MSDASAWGPRALEYLDPAVYGLILREGLYGVERDLKALSLEDLRAVALSMLKHSRVPARTLWELTATPRFFKPSMDISRPRSIAPSRSREAPCSTTARRG